MVRHASAPRDAGLGRFNLYMRGACGVSRWDRESNEDMYRRFGMSETAVGMDCGVVEWVKLVVWWCRKNPGWSRSTLLL